MVKIEKFTDFEIWFLCHSEAKDKEKLWNLPKNQMNEIVLTIGGVEVDFRDAIKELESQFDGMVEKRAKKIAYKKLQQFAVSLKLIDESDTWNDDYD
jgi:hypothetical protein